MIKSIKVNGVHGIDSSLQFKDANILGGQSLLGKTTILNCIMACYGRSYPWYGNWLPEWKVELETDKGNVIMKGKKIIGEIIDSEIIRYILPWNFFKLTNSTVKQREIITKILNIDWDEIEKINEEIRNMESEIKQFHTKKDQITDDIIRIEWYADSLDGALEEPEEAKLIEWNADEINAAYNTRIQKFKDENERIAEDNRRTKEIAEKYKAEEKFHLETEIQSLTTLKIKLADKAAEAKKDSMEYTCDSCGTVIKWKDKEEVVLNLRDKYRDVLEKEAELKNKLQVIIFDIDEHIEEAMEWLERETDYRSDYTLEVKKRAEIIWMKYIERDNADYERYLKEFKDYQEVINKRESYLAEIKIKEEQLKDLNFVKLEKDLKKKQAERLKFNTRLEDKVKETGLDIRLFKTLKNGNTRETFEIYDAEWNQYGSTSTGNELFIEILLAKLFIKYLKIDFILIDRWESIGINLRDKVIKECEWLQMIVTEVTKDKKINLNYNL